MAASRERPKVLKVPNERLFDVRELRWRKKRTRNPVNAHNVGTSQEVGVQAAIAERDRRESNRAPIWIGLQRPRIRRYATTVDAVRPTTGGAASTTSAPSPRSTATMKDGLHVGPAQCRVQPVGRLLRSPLTVGLSKVND